MICGVKELLVEDGVENIHVKLVSIKVNLKKQQKEIESLHNQMEADAIEKEIIGSMRVRSISTRNSFFNLLSFVLQIIQEFGGAYAINRIAITVIDESAR